MKEYPKAMYLGTKKKRQKLTHAKDYDHEQVLRGKGFLPYDQLPDDGASQPQTGTADGGDCAELRQNYEQLQSFSNGLTERWNDVGAVSARLHELTAGVDVYQPVAEPILDPAELPPPPPPPADYNSWTVKQLQAELNRRGISFSSGTNKAELVEMLTQLAGEPVITEIEEER